jgi:hypothetical protein
MIRERPSHLSVVALLEAEGLPASDLNDAHSKHFLSTGTDGAPSALVGLEIYGDAALLRSLVVSAAARTQGLCSALVLHAKEYTPPRIECTRSICSRLRQRLTSSIEAIGVSIDLKRLPPSNPRASSRAFARRVSRS